MVRISQNWTKIAPVKPDSSTSACPIILTEEEVHRRTALTESLQEVDSEMERINQVLGIMSDGWTPNETFQTAKERAALIKEEGLCAVSDDPWLQEMTKKHWPFDDWNEDE